jgi:hypothetical protein
LPTPDFSDLQALPAASVQCLDFGTGPVTTSLDSAQASCDLGRQSVRASVEASLPRILVANRTAAGATITVPAAVQVRSASSNVNSYRLADGTVRTDISTEADGIDILGLVKLGRVVATTQVVTHGRSKTAAVHYSPTVVGAVIAGQPYCQSDCSLTSLAAAINHALGGRAHVDFPTPDTHASGDGRLAFVQDDFYHHVEQVLFNELPDDTVTVPAMRITVNHDGSAPARTIVSLAALSSQEIYRIFASEVPSFGPPTPEPSGQPTLPPVPTPASGNTGSLTAGGEGPQVGGPPAIDSPAEALRAIARGLRIIFRSPGEILGIALLWALLAIPCYLAARRRLLLDLPRLQTIQGES